MERVKHSNEYMQHVQSLALDVLHATRKALARPYGWCKGTDARTVQRRGLWRRQMCLSGACCHAVTSRPQPTITWPTTGNVRDAAMLAIWHAIHPRNEAVADPGEQQARSMVIAFNDARSTRKADVLDVMDRAIQRQEGIVAGLGGAA